MITKLLKIKMRYVKFISFITTMCVICLYNYENLAIDDTKQNRIVEVSKPDSFSSRHLLSVDADLSSLQYQTQREPLSHTIHSIPNKTNCIRPDIEQFPKGFINQSLRRHGLVFIHFLIAAYMFIALAVVCDEYFVPSLNDISKRFDLKEDVAGATFMAVGSSAPELATTLITLFVSKDVDIGIGAVVGSAVFNIMFIISLVALLSGMLITLNWYPLLRDSVFYLIAIFCMILVIMDERVYWYEALFFLILYALYIVAMFHNSKIETWTYAHITFLGPPSTKSDFINIEGESYKTLENDIQKSQSTASFNAEIQSNDGNEKINLGEPEAVHSNACNPLVFPKKDQDKKEKIKYFLLWPIFLVLYFTIPNLQQEKWKKFYLLTFFMSLVWLSLFSYIMVWMITIIGYTFLIPDTIMGITLIAFGASVPDALSSVLVAKSGRGDMAVSNAIGSNVFDILICLGLPWFLKCLFGTVSFIKVKSKGLKYSSITLFATVIILLVSIKLNKWQLDKKLGIFLMCIYLLFILLTSLYEFGTNRTPMCSDSEW